MTRYERLMQMSLEELARSPLLECPYRGEEQLLMCDAYIDSCAVCIEDWLRQEEREGEL